MFHINRLTVKSYKWPQFECWFGGRIVEDAANKHTTRQFRKLPCMALWGQTRWSMKLQKTSCLGAWSGKNETAPTKSHIFNVCTHAQASSFSAWILQPIRCVSYVVGQKKKKFLAFILETVNSSSALRTVNNL